MAFYLGSLRANQEAFERLAEVTEIEVDITSGNGAMAAGLNIYYKQISEGYEDRERFEIMQKVGMTQTEVKQTIRSQVLMVFFLPIVMAGIHIAFAFTIIKLLLAVIGNGECKAVSALYYCGISGICGSVCDHLQPDGKDLLQNCEKIRRKLK